MLFRLLLIFFIIYLITRFFRTFTKIKQYQSNTEQFNRKTDTRKEGEVVISTRTKNEDKKFKKDDGEYIDYEDL